MKLTDKQKKRIIADYIECQNYREVSRRQGVSNTTVKRIVDASPSIVKKVTEKKEANTTSILEFMENRKDRVCDLLDRFMIALADPEKVKNASLVQLTTATGTLIDKWTMLGFKGTDNKPQPITFNFKDADGN